MKLTYRAVDLQLKHPFRIALYTRTHTPIVLVELSFEGFVGYGEASMPQYLGESHATAFEFYKKLDSAGILKKVSAPIADIDATMAEIDALEAGHTAAKAAIDIALHDLRGKILGVPVWAMLGSKPENMPPTSYTIGIEEDPSVLREKVAESDGFDILKIKLGSDDDKKIIRQIRALSDKPLYVDANQGWKNVAQALDMAHWLSEQGVLLIEQPMPKENIDGNARVTEGSPIPTIADESCQRLVDLPKIDGAFHGINVKLMKSTGLNEARKMHQEARKRQLKIMIGCMSETSCGIMAAAALAPQCDFVDLDTPWLIEGNPFATPDRQNGRLQLNGDAGLGIRLNKA